VITDHLMLDVLRSSSAVDGKLCVVLTLKAQQHKSPALCSDFGDLCAFTLLGNRETT